MPINQQIELVRALSMEIGIRPAARKLGVNEDTACSWADRYGWDISGKVNNGPVNSASKLQANPIDILQSELQTHERETRLSLARSARKLASEAESAELSQSSHVLNVAKTAAVVHKWGDEKQNVSFSLNVLNLNMLSDSESDSPGA